MKYAKWSFVFASLIFFGVAGGCGSFDQSKAPAGVSEEVLKGKINKIPEVLLADSDFMQKLKAQLLADPAFLATICDSCKEQKMAEAIKPVVIPKIRPFKSVVKDFAGFKDDCRDSTKGCGSVQKNIEVGSADDFAGYPKTKRAVDEYHELSKPTMEVK